MAQALRGSLPLPERFRIPKAELLRGRGASPTATQGRPNVAPTVANITSTTPARKGAGITRLEPVLYTISGTPSTYTLTNFPPGVQGSLYIADPTIRFWELAVPGRVYSASQANYIGFSASGYATPGPASFNFAAGNSAGEVSTPATYSFQIQPGVASAPVAQSFTNPTLISNGRRQALRNLATWGFYDFDGTVNTFRFTALPAATSGTLYVNGAAAAINIDYPVSNAANLAFQPVAGYSGTALASYLVTDNSGTVSASAAQLGIPVNKAECGQASVFDFTARDVNEAWEAPRTVAVPNSSVTITTSGYTESAGSVSLAVQTGGGGAGYSLAWVTDYSTAANSTSINFNFSRALKGFSFTMGDLDKSAPNNGDPWIDDVTFNGYRADGTLVRLDPSDVNLAPNGNNFFNGDNRITGRDNPATGTNNSTAPDGNTVVTFSEPIVRLELIYKNIQTERPGDPGGQIVTIPAFTWCEEADVATTLTGPARVLAGSTVTYTAVTTNNTGLDQANEVQPTVQLTANLSNVTLNGAPAGAAYNTSTGLLTLPLTNLASGASVTNTITFTMPASGSVTGVASNSAATADPTLGNNNGTAANAQVTTTQNRTPVASNVTTAAVGTTAVDAPLAPLEGSDPDGDNTIAYYTIVTLPNSGTLKLNGVNVAAGDRISPANINNLTYSSPGNNTDRSFTYSVTDDMNATSAAATYSIPVNTVNSNFDLAVDQQVNLGPYRVGQQVTFVINARNVGTVDATANTVQVIAALPTGLTYASHTTAGIATASYNSSNGVWTIGSLNTGNTLTLRVTATINQAGTFTNTATIRSTGTQTESNLLNNVAEQTVNPGQSGYLQNFEGRIAPDLCETQANMGFIADNASTLEGRTTLVASSALGTGSVTYQTPWLRLTTGATLSFLTALPAGTAANTAYRISLLDANNARTQVNQTNYTATTPITVTQALGQTGNYKVEITFTSTGVSSNAQPSLDDVRVTNATVVTAAKDGTNCNLNVLPVANNVTNPRLSNQAGATTISALSGTDTSPGTVVAYIINSIPDAVNEGVLALNGVAAKVGQQLTTAEAAQLTFDPVEQYLGTVSFTYSALDNSNELSAAAATFSIPVAYAAPVSGVIFEDVNYGGGAGRAYAAAEADATASGFAAGNIRRSGARVELYNEDGTLAASTTTGTDGAYTFGTVFTGKYTVRVVNSTVTSMRNTNGVTGLIPVQTYANGDVNRVGGENPNAVDAAANTGSQTFSALVGTGVTPQSITAIQVLREAQPITNVDFGFNFDVVSNTNDAGQGSLRQFTLNSNALPNTNLDQSDALQGAAAGREFALFMLNDGRTTGAAAGLRNGLTASSGYSAATGYTITLSSALPVITDANTTINGNRQTSITGDLVAASATSTGPEITVNFNSQGGIEVTGGGTRLVALGLTGARGTSLAISGADASQGAGITLSGAAATGSQITAVTAYDNATAGVRLENGATGVLVQNNILRAARSTAATGSNVAFDGMGLVLEGAVNNTFTSNTISANAGAGVALLGAAGTQNTGNVFESNTIGGNGVGTNTFNGTGARIGNAGVRVLNGSNNLFYQNTFTGNDTDGIVVGGSSTGNRIMQNSFGSHSSATVTDDLGIDLTAGTGFVGDGVTVNDNTDADAGGNNQQNFPVLTQTSVANNTFMVTGYSAPGALVEFFVADVQAAEFGEGFTYIASFTEGSTDDGDRLTTSYSGPINGLNHGSESNISRFAFSVPFSSLTAAQVAALTSGGARLTATATMLSASTLTLANGTTVPVGNTSEFAGNIALSSTPLPVELVRFAATAQGQDAQLSWATAQEKNNDRFEVERSTDGQRFERVGTVRGAGQSTSLREYAFTDAGAARVGQLLYYRLKQVDFDGTTAYSTVSAVQFGEQASAVTVWPNPAADQLLLNLASLPAGTYQVVVTDVLGRPVLRQRVSASQAAKLSVSSLPAGSYVLSIDGPATHLTRKFVKQQ